MRKYIDGARYDTSTAVLVGSAGNEHLYRTKAGKFFKYSEEWGIRALVVGEAQEWIKEYGITVKAEMVTLSNTIPSTTKAKLEMHASKTGATISEILTSAIEEYCK